MSHYLILTCKWPCRVRSSSCWQWKLGSTRGSCEKNSKDPLMRVVVWWQGHLFVMAAPGLPRSHLPLSCHGEYIKAMLMNSEVKPLSQNNKLAQSWNHRQIKYTILKSSPNVGILLCWNSFSKTWSSMKSHLLLILNFENLNFIIDIFKNLKCPEKLNEKISWTFVILPSQQ